jgi:hypothetical protein
MLRLISLNKLRRRPNEASGFAWLRYRTVLDVVRSNHELRGRLAQVDTSFWTTQELARKDGRLALN